MQGIWSMASSRMGILALGATMTIAGAAIGQKKSTPAPAAKPAAPAPRQTVKPPVQPTRQTGQPQLPGQHSANPQLPGQHPANPQLPGQHPTNRTGPVNIKSANLPVGRTPTAKGYVDVRKDGTKVEYANNHPVALQKPGLNARYGLNGRPAMVRAEGQGGSLQVVHRGPGGLLHAEGFHPVPGGGQVHVVSAGPRNGFVDRPITNRPGFIRRSRMDGDRRYAVVYRGYHYGGVAYYRPVPVVVYSPAYYGWAAQSWGPPVVIQVGFASQPWYGTYGTTFVPYSAYASPDQWMTDQILAQNMQQAYEAGKVVGSQSASADVPLAPPPISPELKEQFDAQVKQEVQEQGQEAQGGPAAVDPPPATANEPDQVPDALKPGHTVFRVVATLDVESDGDDCSLNTDDWIVRKGDMGADGTVPVQVAASRSKDCAQGSTTRISLNDLENMQNEQNEQIGSVLTLMAQSMGKNGMPAGPAPGAVPVPGGKAQPDLTLAGDLQKEQVDANAAEAQAVLPPATGGQ